MLVVLRAIVETKTGGVLTPLRCVQVDSEWYGAVVRTDVVYFPRS